MLCTSYVIINLPSKTSLFTRVCEHIHLCYSARWIRILLVGEGVQACSGCV